MGSSAIRVLIIEDDEMDFLITRRLLENAVEITFEPRHATTLSQGINALSDPPHVILLDLTLPDSMGWNTFSRLHHAAPSIPIILLTGIQDESLGMRAVQAGAEDYLVKGHTDAKTLSRAILYAMERKHAKDHLQHVVEELRRRNEETAADLNLARDVQHALMPRECPIVPPAAIKSRFSLRFSHQYHPCRTIGGDFFTFFPLSDFTAGALVCDVMGHGIRSALVTAILQGIVERLKPHAGDPALLLTELNRALALLLRQPRKLVFVSAAYVLMDIAASRVRVALAGHPPPLLLRSATRPAGIIALNGGLAGPALGLDPDYHYTSREWNLTAGDKVVLFTDGLYEARGASGEEYGMQRFTRLLASAGSLPIDSLLKRIIAEAEAFAGETEFDDDVCLVGIELTEQGGAAPSSRPSSSSFKQPRTGDAS